jgi:hypothetical protein
MTAPTHLSPAPEGAQLAGYHPAEDCFAVLMPDGTARLYIDGAQIEDAAPLHTVVDLARMEPQEYRATISKIKSGEITLGSKHDRKD